MFDKNINVVKRLWRKLQKNPKSILIFLLLGILLTFTSVIVILFDKTSKTSDSKIVYKNIYQIEEKDTSDCRDLDEVDLELVKKYQDEKTIDKLDRYFRYFENTREIEEINLDTRYSYTTISQDTSPNKKWRATAIKNLEDTLYPTKDEAIKNNVVQEVYLENLETDSIEKVFTYYPTYISGEWGFELRNLGFIDNDRLLIVTTNEVFLYNISEKNEVRLHFDDKSYGVFSYISDNKSGTIALMRSQGLEGFSYWLLDLKTGDKKITEIGSHYFQDEVFLTWSQGKILFAFRGDYDQEDPSVYRTYLHLVDPKTLNSENIFEYDDSEIKIIGANSTQVIYKKITYISEEQTEPCDSQIQDIYVFNLITKEHQLLTE